MHAALGPPWSMYHITGHPASLPEDYYTLLSLHMCYANVQNTQLTFWLTWYNPGLPATVWEDHRRFQANCAKGTSVLFAHPVKGDFIPRKAKAPDVGGKKKKSKEGAIAFHSALVLLVISEEGQF